MTTQIQLRRDTSDNWSSANPVLAEGEIGMDMTVNAFKVGDGVSAWDDIDYAGTDISLDDYYTKVEADDAFQPKGDYLTDFVEEDPTVPDHVKGITQDDIDGWNAGGSGGSGSSVHIGDTPPASPEEGQQWMEVPADGDATMWIFDGDKWLQQPGGKDGADGADGLWTDNGDTTISYMDGNVGIGTSDPKEPLHVEGSGKVNGRLAVGDTNSTVNPQISMQGSANTTATFMGGRKSIGFKFANPDGDLMHIDASGNVGIGKDDPKGKLEVDGLIVAKRLSGSDRPTNNAIGGFGFNRNGTAMQGMYLNATDDLFIHNSLSTGKVIFSRASGEETMKLLANGRIGMGVENPSVKLDVNGTIKATNVTRNGIPVIDAKGLIETLATLRQATMDEAQDIRESLRAAIDELMEKFEQQIATMPAEDEA